MPLPSRSPVAATTTRTPCAPVPSSVCSSCATAAAGYESGEPRGDPAPGSDRPRALAADREHAPIPRAGILDSAVFAAPGTGWADLCRLGAQNRRTSGGLVVHTEYLRAWCDVARREIHPAVARLGPLLTSPARGIAAAVRFDIANIVVDAGDADEAQRILVAARVLALAVAAAFDNTQLGF